MEALDSKANPFVITKPEFMRRMKEMSQTGGGGFMGMGNFPEMYNLVVNTNAPLVTEILETKTKKKMVEIQHSVILLPECVLDLVFHN